MFRPGERWSEKDAKVAEGRHMVKGRVGNGESGEVVEVGNGFREEKKNINLDLEEFRCKWWEDSQ